VFRKVNAARNFFLILAIITVCMLNPLNELNYIVVVD
jgi:hypothetical protein